MSEEEVPREDYNYFNDFNYLTDLETEYLNSVYAHYCEKNKNNLQVIQGGVRLLTGVFAVGILITILAEIYGIYSVIILTTVVIIFQVIRVFSSGTLMTALFETKKIEKDDSEIYTAFQRAGTLSDVEIENIELFVVKAPLKQALAKPDKKHPRVVITTSTLEETTWRELVTLFMHELDHIKNMDPLRFNLKNLLPLSKYVVGVFAVYLFNIPLITLFSVVIIGIFSTLLQPYLQHPHETTADESIPNTYAADFASMLMKIGGSKLTDIRNSRLKLFVELLSPHGTLHDRIESIIPSDTDEHINTPSTPEINNVTLASYLFQLASVSLFYVSFLFLISPVIHPEFAIVAVIGMFLSLVVSELPEISMGPSVYSGLIYIIMILILFSIITLLSAGVGSLVRYMFHFDWSSTLVLSIGLMITLPALSVARIVVVSAAILLQREDSFDIPELASKSKVTPSSILSK